MKKLLLTTALVGLTYAHAHASPTQLPDEMLGPWCPAQEQSDRSTTYERSTNKITNSDPKCIQVNPTGYHHIETGCKFERIKPTRMIYVVDMMCGGVGLDLVPSTATFTIIDGKLVIMKGR